MPPAVLKNEPLKPGRQLRGTGRRAPRIFTGDANDKLSRDFQKIPLRINQNTPFQAQKFIYFSWTA